MLTSYGAAPSSARVSALRSTYTAGLSRNVASSSYYFASTSSQIATPSSTCASTASPPPSYAFSPYSSNGGAPQRPATPSSPIVASHTAPEHRRSSSFSSASSSSAVAGSVVVFGVPQQSGAPPPQHQQQQRYMSTGTARRSFPLSSNKGKRKAFEPQSRLQAGGSADAPIKTDEDRAMRTIEQIHAGERGHAAEQRNRNDPVTTPKRGAEAEWRGKAREVAGQLTGNAEKELEGRVQNKLGKADRGIMIR